MKTAHLLFSLNPGGIESFVLQLTDALPSGVETHVLTFFDGPLRARFEACGATVHLLGSLSRPASLLHLYSTLRRVRPDVLNCHVTVAAGAAVFACKLLHIPFILYSHTTRPLTFSPRSLHANVEKVSYVLANRFKDLGIGVSRKACTAFGKQAGRCRLVNLGLDFSRFRPNATVREELMRRWDIPEGVQVVANVAGYRFQKNYPFFLDVAACVVRQKKNVRFLLIGEGREREALEQKIGTLGLGPYCTLTGFVDNVPELLTNVVDVLLFPSLFEGLGLGLVEAQAAGVRCVYSDVVPPEAVVNPDLVRALSLARPAEEWADAVLQQLAEAASHPTDRNKALCVAQQSSFNLKNVVNQYMEIWKQLAR